MEGIIDAVLTLLDLDFTCTADLDDRDAAGELGKTLLELLLVIVAGRVLDLRPDRVDPALNAIRGASAIDEGRSVLVDRDARSEEHTSELQSLMRISYAVFCLKK